MTGEQRQVVKAAIDAATRQRVAQDPMRRCCQCGTRFVIPKGTTASYCSMFCRNNHRARKRIYEREIWRKNNLEAERARDRLRSAEKRAKVYGAVRYDTAEESVAAARRSWRDSKRRAKGV